MVALSLLMLTLGYSVGRGAAQPYPAPVLVSGGCSSASGAPAAASAASVDPPTSSARPEAHDEPQAAARSSKRSKDEELVRSAVGRWRGDDGLTVEVDPPKPLPGRAPPFRVVVRGKGLPKAGFGCEFAGGDERRGPGDMVYFKAWCARGKRATLGLEVAFPEGSPAQLTVVILQDGEVRVRAHGQRVDPTGDSP